MGRRNPWRWMKGRRRKRGWRRRRKRKRQQRTRCLSEGWIRVLLGLGDVASCRKMVVMGRLVG
jgi:hypothetical protein